MVAALIPEVESRSVPKHSSLVAADCQQPSITSLLEGIFFHQSVSQTQIQTPHNITTNTKVFLAAEKVLPTFRLLQIVCTYT